MCNVPKYTLLFSVDAHAFVLKLYFFWVRVTIHYFNLQYVYFYIHTIYAQVQRFSKCSNIFLGYSSCFSFVCMDKEALSYYVVSLHIFICLYTRRHNLFNVAIILCIDSNGFSVIVFFNVV